MRVVLNLAERPRGVDIGVELQAKVDGSIGPMAERTRVGELDIDQKVRTTCDLHRLQISVQARQGQLGLYPQARSLLEEGQQGGWPVLIAPVDDAGAFVRALGVGA